MLLSIFFPISFYLIFYEILRWGSGQCFGEKEHQRRFWAVFFYFYRRTVTILRKLGAAAGNY